MSNSQIPGTSGWNRRSFIKACAAAGTSAKLLNPIGAFALPKAKNSLPRIPTVNDLCGERLTHRFRDLYCSPTAQNEYGYVQAAKSVSGLTGLSLPPYACCGIPDTAWSPGFLLTCENVPE